MIVKVELIKGDIHQGGHATFTTPSIENAMKEVENLSNNDRFYTTMVVSYETGQKVSFKILPYTHGK